MASRAPSHTRQEWSMIKPEFIELYLHQGKKLPQVIKLLQDRGFFASIKQYKTKIKKWGLGKYLNERELLHVARKFSQAKSRGQTVETKVRRQTVTMTDVIKHFGRKSVHENELTSRLPASPTPSVISCRSVGDTEELVHTSNSTNLQVQTRHSPPNSILPYGIGMTQFEVGLLAMKSLAHENTRFLHANPTNLRSWRTSCQIVKYLDRTQYHLNVGDNAQACTSYANVLDIATQGGSSSCVSALQLILQLFSWSGYDNTAPLRKALLRYLAEADATQIHQSLPTVARTLLGLSSVDSQSMTICRRVVCDVFEEKSGLAPLMLFWQRLKLYKLLFYTGRFGEAQSVWKLIENIRASPSELLTPGMRCEIDRGMGITLLLFGNFIVAKQYLEGALNYYLTQEDRYRSSIAYNLQQLAACNAQLHLHNIAHAQAKEAAVIFTTLYGEHDNLVSLALQFASQIETSLVWSDTLLSNRPDTELGRPREIDKVFIVCDAGGGTTNIVDYEYSDHPVYQFLTQQVDKLSIHGPDSTIQPYDDPPIDTEGSDIRHEDQFLALSYSWG